MSDILSDTRCRRAALVEAGEWRGVEALDRAVVDNARCPECLARLGESCRTFGEHPQTRSPHLYRMRNRDRKLALGFGQ